MTEKTISFKREFIPNIIAGVKTRSSRLKKEGERMILDEASERLPFRVIIGDGKPVEKFREKGVYQVVVDEEPVWYCPSCGFALCNFPKEAYCYESRKTVKFIPLLIKVLSIKEQKLMDITNAEAEAEVGTGFKYPRQVFFPNFWECYWNKIPCKYDNQCATSNDCGDCGCVEDKLYEWNPSVWALRFKKANKK